MDDDECVIMYVCVSMFFHACAVSFLGGYF